MSFDQCCGSWMNYSRSGVTFPILLKDSTVSEDAGIEPRTQLWRWQSDALTTRLDLISLDETFYIRCVPYTMFFLDSASEKLLDPQLIGFWPFDHTNFFLLFYALIHSFLCRAKMNRDASLPLPFANFCLKGAKFFFADYEVSDLNSRKEFLTLFKRVLFFILYSTLIHLYSLADFRSLYIYKHLVEQWTPLLTCLFPVFSGFVQVGFCFSRVSCFLSGPRSL